MNAAGTLYASPKGWISSFVGGLAVGAGILAVIVVALSALSWSLPLDHDVRRTIAVTVLASVTLSELVGGWHRKLSFRWLVPTELVNGNDSTAAQRWGRSLGFGFLTDAPYGVFHIAVITPVILGDVLMGLTVIGVFAVARSVPYLLPAVGRNATRIADVSIRGHSVLFQTARYLSLGALTAALIGILL
ncbi:hypothetical protein [Actinomadura sp. HBU206391]|uniref:hypothetical protein n=1 Tax=Actinomadura sp. HBU206391 TaxID=2731692 RepID=UPI00164F2202|nr:hypothetical protein [Actinomadura sp. HBU206391]MBC6458638.1 hypothetical protein [Actinomadura sp. HBU206391]